MNRLAGACLLGCQLMMLWEATEHVMLPLILGVVASAPLLMPASWRFPRWWPVAIGAVMFGLVTLLLNAFPVQLTPGQNIWSMRISAWGIGLQIAHLFGRRFQAVSMVAFAVATICSLSILDFQSYSSYSIGWALVAGATAVVALQESLDWPTWRRAHRLHRGRGASVGLVVALMGILIGGALLSTLISKQMPTVRRWMASQLNISTRRVIRREVGFSTGGWIGTVAKTKETDPLALVLTVRSEQAPGYLRARAYDSFTGTRWLPVRPEVRVDARWLDESAGPPSRGRLFPLLPATGPWRKVTVENAEELRGLFFVPADTSYFDGGGERLVLGRNGDILRAAPSLRYTAYVGRTQETAPPTDSRLTEVPSNFDPRVGQLARRIAARASTDAQKISAITNYLRNQFEYSLEPFPVPDGVDPTSHFLLNREPAHCEYFATGTVALLRHLNVPSRYVIGFLTIEMEDDNTWKARNQDAHAWVEAYDRDRRRWITVDSTPGSGLDENLGDANAVSSSGMLDTNADDENNTWLAYISTFLRHPLSVVGIVGCVVLLVSTLSCTTWSRVDRLMRQRMWLDQRLRRRGFKRMPSETLHQFATRIMNDSPEDPWLQKAAQWQREYATVRFGNVAEESLSDPRQWRREHR